MGLPKILKEFFWDVGFENIDSTANKRYVISRLLELGDEAAVEWLEKTYPNHDLRNAVKTSRSLSPKSRNYWKLKYKIN